MRCFHISFLAVILVGLLPVVAEPTFTLLPMQDGTKLATDVYLPAGDGPWSVVLLRSTYGRSGGAAE